MRDPERWLSDPDAPSGMADLLSAARSVGPSAAERAALATQLGIASSAAWSVPFAVKAFLVTCAAIGTGALAWSLSDGAETTAEHATGQEPAAVASALVEPPVAETVSQPLQEAQPPQKALQPQEGTSRVEPSPAVAATSESETTRPAVKPPVKARVETKPSVEARVAAGSEKPSEARLLAAARGVLAKNPQRALRLLDEHASLYPRGVLAQEREVLRVDALKRAGEQAAAKKAAEAFRKEHPDSVHHLDQ